MDDTYQSSEAAKDKKLLYMSLFLVVIVMFLAAITYFVSNFSSKTKNTANGNPDTNTKTGSNGSFEAINNPGVTQDAPTVSFKTFIVPTSIPHTSSPSSNVYSIKQNFSEQEFKALAHKLQVEQNNESNKDTFLSYYIKQHENTVGLNFDRKFGSFMYVNKLGLPLSSSNTASLKESVDSFVKTIDSDDPTITVTASYKRSDIPGVVFYEAHRDWRKVGLPIVNLAGLFNLSEEQSLINISMNSKAANMPPDSHIYSTTDDTDGLKRANDFNTMTIAVQEADKKVISINSNLRWLQKNTPSSTTLLSYEKAVEKLKSNQYDAVFTSPSGKGQVSLKKIYPENKAVSDQAIINESALVYLEEAPGQPQSELKPYILFRGTSTLNSGYNVTFIAAISASETTKTLSQNREVLGAHTVLAANNTQPDGENGMQQSKLTVIPTLIQQEPANCKPHVDEFIDEFTYKGVVLGLAPKYRYNNTQQAYVTLPGEYAWYYVVPHPGDSNEAKEDQLRKDWATVMEDIHKVDTIELTRSAEHLPPSVTPVGMYTDKNGKDYFRPLSLIIQDFEANQFGACPVIFSGLSPSIFVYGPKGTVLDIKTTAPLTYSDPAAQKGNWHITIGDKNELTVNNVKKNFIYYEHDVRSFTKPAEGYIIDRNDVTDFVKTTAAQMKLNAAEASRLEFEITNAAMDVDSKKLFIGLIDKNEVSKKLPLSFSQNPESIQRYQFYIGKVQNGEKAVLPKIEPVVRKPFMVLEIGAVSEQ